ncbi:MAG: hypothetical protein HQL24_05090 [Candidatus Omnitrophica bacterium]|nr:hypothetical protein [Candidatus Omnitrophota bacterium]
MKNMEQGKKANLKVKKIAIKIIALLTIFSFLAQPVLAQVVLSSDLSLPTPGTMVNLSPNFNPLVIRGLKIFPDNPFHFNFLVNRGDGKLSDAALKEESLKLIKYFLASLTVPEDDLWVNLSPYEKDRIIPEGFGVTQMGRDLLAQDYILKQLTSSLMYPEQKIGKEFWARVYQKAYQRYGTIDIPVDTFNKIWIVPQKAVVYENQDHAYIVESKLKVMLEEDYEAMKEIKNSDLSTPRIKNKKTADAALSTEIMKEVVIPEIEKEVNQGTNFAQLRQIYQSLILAAWFKRTLKESILAKVYVDQNKVNGVDVADKNVKEKIFEQYLKAFKKGVYNYIKEDYDPVEKKIIPKKYFSGGAALENVGEILERRHENPFSPELEKEANENGLVVDAKMLGSHPAGKPPVEAGGPPRNNGKPPDVKKPDELVEQKNPNSEETAKDSAVDVKKEDATVKTEEKDSAMSSKETGKEEEKLLGEKPAEGTKRQRESISTIEDGQAASASKQSSSTNSTASHSATGHSNSSSTVIGITNMNANPQQDQKNFEQGVAQMKAAVTSFQAAIAQAQAAGKISQADSQSVNKVESSLGIIESAISKEENHRANPAFLANSIAKNPANVLQRNGLFGKVINGRVQLIRYDISQIKSLSGASQQFKQDMRLAFKAMDFKNATHFVANPDAAMSVQDAKAATNNQEDVGGIDLSPKFLDLQKTGQSTKFNLPANLQNLRPQDITGLTPVIINIVPVVSVPIFLGINKKPGEDNYAKSDERAKEPS